MKPFLLRLALPLTLFGATLGVTACSSGHSYTTHHHTTHSHVTVHHHVVVHHVVVHHVVIHKSRRR